MVALRILLLVASFWAQICRAQSPGWTANQISTSMCAWLSPRVGVVRDAVYIDGGYLWWEAGLSDGTVGAPTNNDNILGYVYVLNFSLPFGTSSDFNQTALFTNFTKASGTANNVAPNYVDGALFTNDYELWSYGGLPEYTVDYTEQDADATAVYEVYPTIPDQTVGGWSTAKLSNGTTRYIAYGAGVSVPSENLAFYFSGATSKSDGPAYYPPIQESQAADQVSSRMIELEMNLLPPGSATWTNSSIGSIQGRSGGELAWVPVSEQGILVGLGGVTELVYSTIASSFNATYATQIQAFSTEFLDSVVVYDIAKKKWYNQKTNGGPDPGTSWALGCTVVASAEDNSSHNIYWYGGFSGTSLSDPFNDFVWVLSLPSFNWVKLSAGNATHARAGHSCVKPYPDQMFVIGGVPAQPGGSMTCLSDGLIQVFNLSSGTWQDQYDPNVFSNYQVPALVASKIGGDGSGKATVTTPPPGSDPTMTAILASSYNASKITTWYPYHEAVQTSSAPSPSPSSKSSGTPKYLAPVLAVILGLFFITLVILGFLLWRRRRLLSTNQSESGTLDTRFRVSKWLRGTPSDMKAPTVTTADEPISSGFKYDLLMPEAAGVQVHEMMDTSTPAELRGTGPRDTTLTETILSATGLVPISQASPHELSSNAEKFAQRPASTASLGRVDSPTVEPSHSAEFGHARGLSEGTVSVEGEQPAAAEAGAAAASEREVVTPQGQRAGAVSPMTPTEVAPSGGGDYLTKGAEPATESPAAVARRTSNFSEDLDEHRDTR